MSSVFRSSTKSLVPETTTGNKSPGLLGGDLGIQQAVKTLVSQGHKSAS
jgi:hypothetical protein